MRALIGLGANLGAPLEALREALEEIAALEQVKLLATSSFYSTSPVDSSGPDYVNAVALVEAACSPETLLRSLQAIENAHGRVRPAGVHNAPRTLDLDLLDFGDVVMTSDFLTLPHPRMLERLFVLVPLSEICPDWQTKAGVPITTLIEQVRNSDPTQHIRKLEH